MPVPDAEPRGPTPRKFKPVYATPFVNLCLGKDALRVDQAKKLLGWEEETPEEKFGSDYLLRDMNKRKVRCAKNSGNREFNQRWAETIAQDVLNLRWRFNFETVVIGAHDNVLSGQHRLIGLVLASQMWAAAPEGTPWRVNWPGEPTLEVAVGFGVDEGPETTRTLDNVRPRTLADVLFCDGGFYPGAAPGDRGGLCRATDYAVRLLWSRGRGRADAYAPGRRTHSEAIDFLTRHRRLTEAVKHLYEENGSGKIAPYVSPGTAAGFMYLMATCRTDPAEYRAAGAEAHEGLLDWTEWDRAESFWAEFGTGRGLAPLREALKPEVEGVMTSLPQIDAYATIIRAWHLYLTDQPITPVTVRPEREKNADGEMVLVGDNTCGGIDLGDPRDSVDDPPDTAPVPTADELAGEKERINQEQREARSRVGVKATPPKKAAPPVESDEAKTLRETREANPGRVLLYQNGAATKFTLWGEDAQIGAGILRIPSGPHACGLLKAEFPAGDLDAHAAKLIKARHKVATVRKEHDKTVVSDYRPPSLGPARPRAVANT